MTQPQPTPSRALSYESTSPDAWPLVLKIVAIVALILAAIRLTRHIIPFFLFFTGNSLALGFGLSGVTALAAVAGNIVAAAVLLTGSILALNRSPGARRTLVPGALLMMLVSPLYTIAQLLSIPWQGLSNSGALPTYLVSTITFSLEQLIAPTLILLLLTPPPARQALDAPNP